DHCRPNADESLKKISNMECSECPQT
ncbi:hypothetical protein NPIL_611981, partial [Nephila pilipes]